MRHGARVVHGGRMPRPNRIQPAGWPCHVGSRGNNKDDVVRDDHDRALFVWMLSNVARRHGWTLLSYVVMTNHYHLLLRPGDEGLSTGMQLLNGRFARAMNMRYGRVGHLFQNRFHSEVIESDRHLLEAMRYLDLNPLRAGICREPHEWRWGSYRACVGLDHPIAGHAIGDVLAMFGSSPDMSRTAYRRFVSEGRVPVSDTVAGT
jgi:REP-associated tyrosine transposase